MAIFKQDEPGYKDRLDWRILHDSPIALYFKPSILQADVAWFVSEGYRVFTLRAGVSASPEALLLALGRLLSFPEYFGSNLDAFNECLGNVDVPDTSGLILVLEDFSTFAAAFRHEAQALLDICAHHSRRFLLIGRRFMVLAHSKDARLHFDPVGASPVLWNSKEWSKSARGL